MKTKKMTLVERNYLRTLYRVMSVELMARRVSATEAEAAEIDSQLAELEEVRP